MSTEYFDNDSDNALLDNLKQLSGFIDDTSSLIINNRPCTNIFEQFSKIKQATVNIENLLLASHLKNCFVKEIPYMGNLYNALQKLSAKKYGALVVVERNDRIENIINQKSIGVIIDARLSEMLLECIFYPGSSLHDGAVIIKNQRIYSASSVLPLSKEVTTNKKLGTRHRAAIGLSEICDALTFVVSEETQQISLAFKGELMSIEQTRNITFH